MGAYARTYNFVDGTVAYGSQLVTELDAIASSVNNIVGAQISSGAAIADIKLATISTAGKVDCSALVNSENIPAGEVNGASQLVQMTSATKLPAVDGSLLTGVLKTQVGFGAWNNGAPWVSGTAYLAATDGFVCALFSGAGNCYIYTDSANPPTVTRAIGWANSGAESCTSPVKKGEYWKASTNSTIYWIPLGS